MDTNDKASNKTAQAHPLELLNMTMLLGDLYQRYGEPHYVLLSFISGTTAIRLSLTRIDDGEQDE